MKFIHRITDILSGLRYERNTYNNSQQRLKTNIKLTSIKATDH